MPWVADAYIRCMEAATGTSPHVGYSLCADNLLTVLRVGGALAPLVDRPAGDAGDLLLLGHGGAR